MYSVTTVGSPAGVCGVAVSPTEASAGAPSLPPSPNSPACAPIATRANVTTVVNARATARASLLVIRSLSLPTSVRLVTAPACQIADYGRAPLVRGATSAGAEAIPGQPSMIRVRLCGATRIAVVDAPSELFNRPAARRRYGRPRESRAAGDAAGGPHIHSRGGGTSSISVGRNSTFTRTSS